MAQLFSERSNSIVRASLIGGPVLLATAVLAGYGVYFSPYNTDVGEPVHQPVPFSHQHHSGGLGIDCRYCHTAVEKSSSAGIPPTETCMTCHSQIWRDAPVLAPVRESWNRQIPMRWTRVHDLPDYVYFNHSVHVANGVACVNCHGRVDQMPLMWKANSLFMRWCLDCHRHPEKAVGPASAVFSPDPQRRGMQPQTSEPLAQRQGIARTRLEDCSICHR